MGSMRKREPVITDRRLRALERYRVEKGLSYTDMSQLLGAPAPQNYNNWRYRNSLPKQYWDVADALVAASGDPSLDLEIMSLTKDMDERQKRATLLHMRALLGNDSDS